MADFEKIESELQEHLSDDSLKFCNEISGGIINRAALFRSRDTEQNYFVKYNPAEKSRQMFEAEQYSLQLLADTGCVSVPTSFKVFSCKNSPGAVHVLEYMPGLTSLSDHWAKFGQQIGRLHSHNSKLREKAQQGAQSVHGNADTCKVECVEKFGSDYEHYIGMFTLERGWRNSWQELFIGNILQPLISGIVEKYRDKALEEKWAWLQLHLHKMFDKASIVPAINHGDLCVANFGQTEKGPVLFDPSVLYGDSQFDLILSHTEEKFDPRFFEEYHRCVPKGDLWDECMLVYDFFYSTVMLYHGAEEDIHKTAIHSKADQVKNMLQCQFLAN